MTSSRRPLVSGKLPSFSRTIFFQSGMTHLHDAIDGSRKSAPARALFGKNFATRLSQTVVAPAASACRFPFALDPTAPLEAIKQRIERSDVEAHHAFGALGDELADFIAVTGLVLEKREDQQFGVAFFEFSVGCNSHIW